jgi:hypothetical protein
MFTTPLQDPALDILRHPKRVASGSALHSKMFPGFGTRSSFLSRPLSMFSLFVVFCSVFLLVSSMVVPSQSISSPKVSLSYNSDAAIRNRNFRANFDCSGLSVVEFQAKSLSLPPSGGFTALRRVVDPPAHGVTILVVESVDSDVCFATVTILGITATFQFTTTGSLFPQPYYFEAIPSSELLLMSFEPPTCIIGAEPRLEWNSPGSIASNGSGVVHCPLLGYDIAYLYNTSGFLSTSGKTVSLHGHSITPNMISFEMPPTPVSDICPGSIVIGGETTNFWLSFFPFSEPGSACFDTNIF